jgi:hypothetical protein
MAAVEAAAAAADAERAEQFYNANCRSSGSR